MSNIYLNPWEWTTETGWTAPGGDAIGLIDLRSLPQMALAGGVPEGYGLFVYDSPRRNMELDLGSDIDGVLSAAQKNGIETLLGARILSITLRQAIRELFLAFGDATGQTAWKLVRGSLRRGVGLTLNPFGRIFQEPLTPSHPAMQTTIDVFRADYRRNRELVNTGDIPLRVLQKWAGAEQLKLFGRMTDENADAILPTEYITDRWMSPATSISDNFNRADESLDADANWSEFNSLGNTAGNFSIVSNIVEGIGNGWRIGRHDTALSSDDHYSQIDFISIAVVTKSAVVVVRYPSGGSPADSFYWGRARYDGTALQYEIAKVVTGSHTSLAQGSTAPVSGDTGKLEVSNSDLEFFLNTVSHLTASDSAITGNLHTGIGMKENSSSNPRMDNFEAADLAAAAARRIFVIS